MTRAALLWILDRNHQRRRWIAAGLVLLGLGAMNQQPHSARSARPTDFAPVQAHGFGGGPASQAAGAEMVGSAARDQSTDNEPAMRGGSGAPAAGYYAPAAGEVTPATATPGGDSSAQLPSTGDSVPESVNTNFSDTMRDQQRVVSENDGQTYIVNSNADPNQMTDTRDGVSGFTQATPGGEAAGYADVAPSGATTVDTSTSTPVDTSSASSSTSGE